MNKAMLLISMLFFWLQSQSDTGLIAQKIITAESQNVFEKRNDLFKKSDENIIPESVVKNPTILELNFTTAKNLIQTSPEFIILTIPVKNNIPIELKLFKTNLFTSDFSIVTSSGIEKTELAKNGVHYWGIVSNDLSSIAAISIFENEVMGMISSESSGNIILGPIENDKLSRHILYNQNNFTSIPGYTCMTSDLPVTPPKKVQTQNSLASVNCVRLYWEVNYDVYLNKGGTSGVTNFITGILNQSNIIYANDGISVSLEQLVIWDKPSPYTNTTIMGMLSSFQSYRTSFNGDIGNLIAFGAGGISGNIGQICDPNRGFQQCFSGIVSSYASVPTYSPTIEGITHEQGHLMGSFHTHACVWNGNNTAIDGCGPAAGYPYEGSCTGAPIPTNGGTVMSFCHLNSTGINFSKGFGPQPKNAILNLINSSPCLQSCSTTSTPCDTPTSASIKTITSSTASLEWNPISSASAYNVQYRQAGTSTWITVNIGAASFDLTGLSPNTIYEWRIQTDCSGSTSMYTTVKSFTTLALSTCDLPTVALAKSITSSSVWLDWNPVAGAVSYNVQFRRVGFSTWNTVNTIEDSLQLTGLVSNAGYEWRIQTVCSTLTGIYSSPNNFTTVNVSACGIPTSLSATQITSTSSTLTWSAIPGAINYTLMWKRTSNSSWNTVSNITNNSYNLTGLSSCRSYDYRVRATCSSTTGTNSSTFTFSTIGCPLSYCTSRGTSSSSYYINRVAMGSISNTSGNNGGYSNYSSQSTNIRRNISYSITLTPSNGSSQKYWNVYIDYNQNGSFQDANEMVASGRSSSSLTLNFTVPSTALTGSARMRIQMKTSSYATNSCTTFTYGEVEDYSVNILTNSPSPLRQSEENIFTEKNALFKIYPDPANDYIIAEIESASSNIEILIFDIEGRILRSESRILKSDSEKIKIEIEEFKNGIYFLGIQNGVEYQTKKFIVLKELN